jgi:hypothetical protein
MDDEGYGKDIDNGGYGKDMEMKDSERIWMM